MANKTFLTGLTVDSITVDPTTLNVGIGGAASTYKLDVTGTTRITGLLTGNSYIFSDGQYIRNSNQTDGNGLLYLDATNLNIRRADNGTSLMYVKSDGKVGIGTTSPTSILNISSSVNNTVVDVESQMRILNTYSGSVATLGFSSNDSDGQNGRAGIVSGKDSGSVSGYLAFVTRVNSGAFAERMRITSGGFTKASNNGSYFNSTDTVHEFNNSATTSWTTIFRNMSADPYGIRILYSGASPNGGSNYFIYAQDNTTARYTVSSNGSATSSDERLKKNIETTRNGYLEDLCKLRVVKYNWFNQEDTDDKLLGIIAQEVEAVFPKLIKEEPSTDGSTTYKMIKDTVLPYMLLKAIQEQNTLITDLRTEVNELKKKIVSL